MTVTLMPRLGEVSSAPALVVEDRTLSWSELACACAHHVAALAAVGIGPGDRVGVWTQPAIETAVALVAHAAAGIVSVPIDPKLGPIELGHILADAAPALCVAADPVPVADRARLGFDRAATTIATVIDTSPITPFPPRPITNDPALVLYTSGTTGAPKGALLTYANLASDLDMLARAWGWTADDTVVHALPLFHVHGLVLGLFGSLRRGGALRWLPRFVPEDLARAVGATPGPTMLFAVPTMYNRLCDAAERDASLATALRAARLLVSGSAPLATREFARLERLTGHRAIERYGLTETLILCSTRHDDPDRRAGSVGPPLDALELRLVDDDRRTVAGSDEIGEICVRGPNVFAGYLNRPEATAAVLDAEGWFSTGDLAVRSPDGQLRIVGRRSTDIIKCGGYKVGAGEVEAALLDHPDVAEAAVLGAPDDDLGERIVAFVVARAASTIDPRALEDHVAKQLSPHKRPREVHVLGALPRNAMGKVQKSLLRTRR